MPLDSDVAILGTGVASLAAANLLISQGISVLLLNPDRDFFLEDSELPLDPLIYGKLSAQKILRNSPENALKFLRPDFPGAIEYWSGTTPMDGYHDPSAPHVRQRGRLWISSANSSVQRPWEALEDFYVEASDADLHPQLFDDWVTIQRFPGCSSHSLHMKGLFVPKLCDVDTVRYRNGLLEFVRERLPEEKFINGVTQLEWMPEGIRFHSDGTLKTAKLRKKMLAFWTPRLTPWILYQAKTAEIKPKLPIGARLWEDWLLNSREAPDPQTIGTFNNMIVWAHSEGAPSKDSPTPLLAILRAGPLIQLEEIHLPKSGGISSDSFKSLSDLCHGFLKWESFSIRSLKTRIIFEWDDEVKWLLSKSEPLIEVIPACDGPLVDVVRVARSACEPILMEA